MPLAPDRWQAAWRCLHNHCPRCGQGRLLKNLLDVHTHCPSCNFVIDRGHGFMLGSVPISYFIYALLVLIPLLLLWSAGRLSFAVMMPLVVLSGIAMPLLLNGYSKLLWLAIYYFWLYREIASGTQD